MTTQQALRAHLLATLTFGLLLGPAAADDAATLQQAENEAYGRWEQSYQERLEAAKKADDASVERSKAEEERARAQRDAEKARRDADTAKQQEDRFDRPGPDDQPYRDAQENARKAEEEARQVEEKLREAAERHRRATDRSKQADEELSKKEEVEKARRRELEDSRVARDPAFAGRRTTSAAPTTDPDTAAVDPGRVGGDPSTSPGTTSGSTGAIAPDGSVTELARALADFNAAAKGGGGPVIFQVQPNGDVVLARGSEQVVIPNGMIRGINQAQSAVNKALTDPKAVKDLEAFVDRQLLEGNDAALQAVLFALDAAPARDDLAGVKERARGHLATLAVRAGPTAQAQLATIDARAQVLQRWDYEAGQRDGSSVLAYADSYTDVFKARGWQALGIAYDHVVLTYVQQLHNLARSSRTPQEQVAVAGRLIRLFDEARALQSVLPARSAYAVRFGDTVSLKPLDGGAPLVYEIVPPDQADRSERQVSSNDPIGQALLGRLDGEEVQLGERRYAVTIDRGRSTYWHIDQPTRIAEDRLTAVQAEIQTLLTVPDGSLCDECRERAEWDLRHRSGMIFTYQDTFVARAERELSEAFLAYQDAQRQLADAERDLGIDPAYRSLYDPELLEQSAPQQWIRSREAEVAKAQARLDQARRALAQARRDRDEAFTNYGILALPVDGQPLYVHLAKLPPGESGWNLIERARAQQIALAQQQLVWWGTKASPLEQLEFFAFFSGERREITEDPILQALFGGPQGVSALMGILVGTAKEAGLERQDGQRWVDIGLGIVSLGSVFLPPLGVVVFVVGTAVAVDRFGEEREASGRAETGAQTGVVTRVDVAGRSEGPSVGALIVFITLDAVLTGLDVGIYVRGSGGAGKLAGATPDAPPAATAAGPTATGGGQAAADLTPAPVPRPTDGTPSSGARAPPASPPPGTTGLAAGGADPPPIVFNPAAVTGPVTATSGTRLTTVGPDGTPRVGFELGDPVGAGGQGAVFEVVGINPPRDGFTVSFDVGPSSTKPGVVRIRVDPPPADGNMVAKTYKDGDNFDPVAGRREALESLQAEGEGANFLRDKAGIRVPATHGVAGLDGSGTPVLMRERFHSHPAADDFATGKRSSERQPPTPEEGPVTYYVGDRTLSPQEQQAIIDGIKRVDAADGVMPDVPKKGNYAFEILPGGEVRFAASDTAFAGPMDDALVGPQVGEHVVGTYGRPSGFDELLDLDETGTATLESLNRQTAIFEDRGLFNAYTAHAWDLVVFDVNTGQWGGLIDPAVARQFPPLDHYMTMIEQAWRRKHAVAGGPRAPVAPRPPGMPETMRVPPPRPPDPPAGSSAPAAGAAAPTSAPAGGSPAGAGASAGPAPAATGAATGPGGIAPGTTTPLTGSAADAVSAAARAAAAAVRAVAAAVRGAGPASREHERQRRTGESGGTGRRDATGSNDFGLRYAAPRDSRVAVVPGSAGKPRIGVRWNRDTVHVLEIPGPLPESLVAAAVKTVVKLIPSAREIPHPVDSGVAMAFTFEANADTVQQLTDRLGQQGIGFRLESEVIILNQDTLGRGASR